MSNVYKYIQHIKKIPGGVAALAALAFKPVEPTWRSLQQRRILREAPTGCLIVDPRRLLKHRLYTILCHFIYRIYSIAFYDFYNML